MLYITVLETMNIAFQTTLQPTIVTVSNKLIIILQWKS